MNFQALKNLIDSDPDNLGRSDDEVAVWANTPSVLIYVPFFITTRTIMGVLGAVVGDALISSLEALAADDSVIARTLTMLEPSQQGVDVGHSGTRESLDALVAAGALGLESVQTLKSLGESIISPSANAGLGSVTAVQVAYARAEKWL